MRRKIAACLAVAASVAAPVALASGPKPTKAWKGYVNLFATPITVLEFPGGEIEVGFAPSCSFSSGTTDVKTVARGRLSGSHFTMNSATVPGSVVVSKVDITGTIGRHSVKGSTEAVYAKSGTTCYFQRETFKAVQLKKVPKSL